MTSPQPDWPYCYECDGPSAGTCTSCGRAFCSEHGVAEAVCTKCNPKLAAIFQEKGDWCAEHGFPESFCPICRPELLCEVEALAVQPTAAPTSS